MALPLGIWGFGTTNEDIVAHVADVWNAKNLDGARFLVAAEYHEDYEGEGFYLFEQNGRYWEVNGSHCSCNGFDDQWKPEETTVAYLLSGTAVTPQEVVKPNPAVASAVETINNVLRKQPWTMQEMMDGRLFGQLPMNVNARVDVLFIFREAGWVIDTNEDGCYTFRPKP